MSYYKRKGKYITEIKSDLCTFSCSSSIDTNFEDCDPEHNSPYESKIDSIYDLTLEMAEIEQTAQRDIKSNKDKESSLTLANYSAVDELDFSDVDLPSNDEFESSKMKREDSKTEESPSKKFECPKKCGLRFKSQGKMNRHSEECNAGQTASPCKLCEKYTKRLRKIQSHFEECSSKLSAPENSDKSNRSSSLIQLLSTKTKDAAKKRKIDSMKISPKKQNKRKCVGCSRYLVDLEKHQKDCRPALIKFVMDNVNCLLQSVTTD